MKKLLKILISCSLLLFLYSCKKNEIDNQIIRNSTLIEFRYNNHHYSGRLELIDNSSNKFELLKSYFNNLKGFKEPKNEINIFPNYILLNKHFKILITVNQIYIEYYNSNNQLLKLHKDISPDEYLSFNYLTEDNKWIYDLGKIYGVGEFKSDKFEKGGLMQTIVDYEYKVGKWKFWNINRELIAEGEFEADSSYVIGQSDSDYFIKTSKINKNKWKFYNPERQLIEPKFEDLFILENASRNNFN